MSTSGLNDISGLLRNARTDGRGTFASHVGACLAPLSPSDLSPATNGLTKEGKGLLTDACWNESGLK